MATPTTKRPESTAPRRPVRNNAMLLRLISRVLVGALVVAVAIVLVAHALVGNDQNATAHLQGTSLGGTAAPTFTLTDQNGTPISLAALRGHPVVLTFFYTHCTDECPLTASKFQRVLTESGTQFKDVRWVAVSTDPYRRYVTDCDRFCRESWPDWLAPLSAWHAIGACADMGRLFGSGRKQ